MAIFYYTLYHALTDRVTRETTVDAMNEEYIHAIYKLVRGFLHNIRLSRVVVCLFEETLQWIVIVCMRDHFLSLLVTYLVFCL